MTDIVRRRWVRGLGALGAAATVGRIGAALASGDVPPGLHLAEGSVTVNGRPAARGAKVAPGDRIATGPGSQAIVVLKGDAFLVRADTVIELKGRDGVLTGLTIAVGKLLSVFSGKPVSVKAGSAAISIRGTGAYIEVEPASVYVCLCYGEALVEGPRMQAKLVRTRHHEQPLVLREEGGIMRAEPGPVINHTDAELILLESLVGREPPFVRDGSYPAQRY